MRQRIKELALDAGLLNYVDHETPRHYFINGHADLEDVAKFAELVILETRQEAADEIERLRKVKRTYAKWLSETQKNHLALKEKVRQWLDEGKPTALKERE